MHDDVKVYGDSDETAKEEELDKKSANYEVRASCEGGLGA